MRSYNRVILVGNLTREPDIRSFPNGTRVANCGLALNEKRKDQSGNYVDDVSYIDVTFWGHCCETIEQYARKGTSLLVEGRLKQETWEKDGVKASKVKVIADRVNLMGGGGRSEEGSGSNNGGYKSQNFGGGYRNQNNGGGYQRQNGSGYSSQGNNGGSGGYRSNGSGGSYAPQPQEYVEDPNIPF